MRSRWTDSGYAMRLDLASRMRIPWLLACIVSCATGCHSHQHRTSCHWTAEGKPVTLPMIVRPGIELDVNRLAELNLGMPFAGAYRALTEKECQCLAVEASSMGNALDDEARLLTPKHNHGHHSNLKSSILET